MVGERVRHLISGNIGIIRWVGDTGVYVCVASDYGSSHEGVSISELEPAAPLSCPKGIEDCHCQGGEA